MTPEQAIEEATQDKLRPVYVVVGEERWLADRVVDALRQAACRGGIAGFNEDKLTAGEASAESIVNASRMLPMMAKRRFVLARGLERWEKKAAADEDDDDAPAAETSRAASPLDQLADYAKAPVDSTVLVLSATKLHGQRKLVTAAKKGGYFVACDAVDRRELPGFVTRLARDKGHPIAHEVADLLAEIAGPELGYVADAIERLSLFVGDGAPITEDAVAAVVTKVRQGTVWQLVGALSQRKLDRALAALAETFDGRDGGLKLLGAVTWSVKQLVKFEAAIAQGASADEAARRSGVAPFRARETLQVVRAVPKKTLDRWMAHLAEADLALKGSRRPADAVLETMIISMCR